ncbi:type II secretion system protein [Niveibacterium microcysteis]|uniref:Prepilin-type N-terminal cleavage/methylation domain-containing protein n=1 Tax=Niveibacterium microcysteis TaxID=2811415 RepID=A0ABX7M1E4_9RHOO|nr:prepilin-type N-terminal cleavage/methylation domain-containing protein [Niveibacterium microcysteis]QSI75593.1 prepilin-type N-terminal cleavage/methylation domain-containing protein [Niveibacterium microcysteis]
MKRSAGFTLLEMLVVLAITSMVFALLMESLQQAFRIQLKLNEVTSDSTGGALADAWFRDLIEGLQPGERLSPQVFKGESTALSGLTLRPVSASSEGMPTQFTLSLVVDRQQQVTRLRYRDATLEAELHAFPSAEVRFVYQDDDGAEFEQWPPNRNDPPQIPALVRVVWGKSGADFGELVARPSGPVVPLPAAAGIFGIGGAP